MATQVPLSDAHHRASRAQQLIEKKSVPHRTKKGSVQESVNTRAFAAFLSGRLVEHPSAESVR
jgi:hypothetical protein